MVTIRKSNERGMADHGWLLAKHSFSFGQYYDPRFMGFNSLRVINQDRVAPGKGFATHGHKDMEIITVVTKGQLKHQDSMGNGSVINPGEIQYMSAGSGVTHSELNPQANETLELLQIWIEPDQRGQAPRYQQIKYTPVLNGLKQLVAPEHQKLNEDCIGIYQSASIFWGQFEAGTRFVPPSSPKQAYWLQIIQGDGMVDDNSQISSGDGISWSASDAINVQWHQPAQFLLFELAEM